MRNGNEMPNDRRVSPEDIFVVQNLIERCLQLYMTRAEVMETLWVQARIEPVFTELVWQKLEEENEEFFRAYNERLSVKSLVSEFNTLFEQHVRLTGQKNQTGVNPANGSHLPPSHGHLASYAPEHAESSITGGSNLLNAFKNVMSSPTMHSAAGASSHVNNTGTVQGTNGQLVESESSNSDASPYLCDNGSILESSSSPLDASGASFSTEQSSAQTLTEPLLDPEPSLGSLNEIPQNFSLLDLVGDFSQSTDNKSLDTTPEGTRNDASGSE